MKFSDSCCLRQNIRDHVKNVWQGREIEYFSWDLGPIKKVLPDFRVARVRPKKESESWVYVSQGMSAIHRPNVGRLEVFVLSPKEEALHVELLAMVAHFCADPKLSLDLYSILDIGRPWIEGGSCNHLLISLPYTVGPRLEWMKPQDGEAVRFLWALPITKAEAGFARRNDVESLEQLFDEHRINPVDPGRASVV